MMIRKECIGTTFRKKSPYNAEVFTGTIKDDPSEFQLYRILQLDVFEKFEIPSAEVKTEKPSILKHKERVIKKNKESDENYSRKPE